MCSSRIPAIGLVAGLVASLGGAWAGGADAQEPALVLNDGGIQFPDDTVLETAAGSYAGVTVVAKTGAGFTSIQAAIDSLPDPVAEPHLIWVAPGIYEEQVTLKRDVHVRGAGIGHTRIVTSGPVTVRADTGIGRSMSSLSVEILAGGTGGVGIQVGRGGLDLEHVSVDVAGPSVFGTVGIAVGDLAVGGHLRIRDSEVSVDGGGERALGIAVAKASLEMSDSRVSVVGSGDSIGIEVIGDGASARIFSSDVESIDVGNSVFIFSSALRSVRVNGGHAHIQRGSSVGTLEVLGTASVVHSSVDSTDGEPSQFRCFGAYREDDLGIMALDSQCQPVP